MIYISIMKLVALNNDIKPPVRFSNYLTTPCHIWAALFALVTWDSLGQNCGWGCYGKVWLWCHYLLGFLYVVVLVLIVMTPLCVA